MAGAKLNVISGTQGFLFTRSKDSTSLGEVGDNHQAMHWLERAYEERFNPSILLRSGFDPLRSDPRFKDLVRRIGLPE
jgi:hypothetical protein